jgi:signal transduction histidine kinase
MSVGTSLNLDKILKSFLSALVKNLELSGATIYEHNRGVENGKISIPRDLEEDEIYLQGLKLFLKDQTLSYTQVENRHFYKFNIMNFGFNILILKAPLERDVYIHLPEIYIKLGIAIQSAMLNIDLQKKVEREVMKHRHKDVIMFQQARLTSIAELIGNISHQWRQPLNNLSILIQDIKEAYDFDDFDDEYIEHFIHDSMSNINSMSRTIDNFRNFFDTNEKENISFSVREVVEDAVKLVKDSFSSNDIQIVFKKFEDFIIKGNKVNFSQAIINILNNAQDVLCDKWVKNASIWIEIDRSNKEITIEDNGGGVPQEIIDKIFEPYFTTKHQSSGTGIGLYMSKITVERNFGGILSVTNRGNDAIFSIKFK